MPYFHHFMAESVNNSNKCCSATTTTTMATMLTTTTTTIPGSKNINGLTKAIKSGYLLYFKKRMFCKAWREAYVVLYEDSSLIWYRDRDRNEAEGGIFLKDAPEMLAAGQWTSRVPLRPEFPSGCDSKLSIAIGSRNREKVNWFLCKSENELIDWMSAINYTLPLPPPPPEELRETRRSKNSSRDELHDASFNESADVVRGLRNTIASTKTLRHQPSAPDLMISTKLQQQQQQQHHHHRTSVQNFQKLTGNGKSSSTGKMNHLDNLVDWNRSSNGSGNREKREIRRSNSFRETRNYKINHDLAPALMVAAIMTQWNANGDCWDWGMGWGWAGWSASYCDTCALEHAAVTAHVASSAGLGGHGTHGQSHPMFSEMLADPKTSSFRSSHTDLFVYDDDNEVTELGDTDVACDFGGDFGGF